MSDLSVMAFPKGEVKESGWEEETFEHMKSKILLNGRKTTILRLKNTTHLK